MVLCYSVLCCVALSCIVLSSIFCFSNQTHPYYPIFNRTLSLEPLIDFGVGAHACTPTPSGGEGLKTARGGLRNLNPST